MSEESARQDVEVSVGKNFVIMGGDRIEVSPDGKKVTAYTNDGVETKAAFGADDTRVISISICADFNTVVLNGTTIQRAADGHLVISSPGTVITKPAPANDSATINRAPQIGDKMPAGHPQAGWIYAGISKSSHQPFYVAPKDSGVLQWKKAMAFAAEEGSRVPSKEELDQIFDARGQGALKGTFNVSGSDPAGWYWSSSQYYGYSYAWAQHISDGTQFHTSMLNALSLRCVR